MVDKAIVRAVASITDTVTLITVPDEKVLNVYELYYNSATTVNVRLTLVAEGTITTTIDVKTVPAGESRKEIGNAGIPIAVVQPGSKIIVVPTPTGQAVEVALVGWLE